MRNHAREAAERVTAETLAIAHRVIESKSIAEADRGFNEWEDELEVIIQEAIKAETADLKVKYKRFIRASIDAFIAGDL